MRTGAENMCFPTALAIPGIYPICLLEKIKGSEIFKEGGERERMNERMPREREK